MTHNKDGWAEMFDEKFVKDNGDSIEPSFSDPNGQVGPVKSFIKSLLKDEKKKWVEEVKKTLESIVWESEWQKVNKLLKKLKSK